MKPCNCLNSGSVYFRCHYGSASLAIPNLIIGNRLSATTVNRAIRYLKFASNHCNLQSPTEIIILLTGEGQIEID